MTDTNNEQRPRKKFAHTALRVFGVLLLISLVTTSMYFAISGAIQLRRQVLADAEAERVQDSRIAESKTQLEAQASAIADQQKDIDRRLAQLAARLDVDESRRGRDDNTVRAEIRALDDSLAALRAEFGRNAAHWRLEEVARVLQIADHQLRLAGDVTAARDALQFAHARLEQIPDRALTPVRDLINEQIVALENAHTPDVADTLTKLAALAAEVYALPLAGDPRDGESVADNPTPVEDGSENNSSGNFLLDAGKNFLADISALVQVEIDNDSPSPILSTESRRIIHQKVDLILESCQLALLRAQDEIYAARIAAAKKWVRENFDTDDAQVNDWLARLTRLEMTVAQSKTKTLPDISAALRALRDVMDEN